MKSLLVIGHGIPEPHTTGAGVRMMQLLRMFKALAYDIHFCSTAQHSSESPLIKENIRYTQIELNNDSFNEFIQELNPKLVVYDRFMTEEQFGWRVRESCPKALTLLDTEDLHFLRKSREQGHTTINPSGALNETAKRELAAIMRTDVSLIISEKEMQLLTQMFPSVESQLLYIPFLLQPEELPFNTNTYEEREGFYFVGNGKHSPNVSAIEYLHEIWPNIKKFIPDATLTIYGAYLPDKIVQLHNPLLGIYIKGFVNDLKTTLSKHRVLLAPIRFGAGQKRKIFDAWISGSPVVTTFFGAEGIGSTKTFGGHVVEKKSDFIQMSVSLYNTKSAWEKEVNKGQQLLTESFNWEFYKTKLQTYLAGKEAHLDRERNHNVMGQILWHHSLQSTKYLSKWIQEKNRSKEPPA